MKRKQYYLYMLAVLWLALILDSRTAQIGASEGIQLCMQAAIPSLFPFFFISNFTIGALQSSISGFAKLDSFLPISYEVLIPSILGGYPMGSSTIAQLYRDNQLSKSESEKLLSLNLPGPAFLFGLVSKSFTKIRTVWLLWIIILVSWMLTSFPQKAAAIHLHVQEKHISINESISFALQAMGKVCSWIIIFRIMLEYLKKWLFPNIPLILQVIITGVLEITNGCLGLNAIDNESLRFILCAGLLSFGGICVTMQTAAVTTPLSLKPYLKSKILQSLWAILISAAVFYPCFRTMFFVFFASILLFRLDFFQFLRYNIRKTKEVPPCCFVKK